MAVGLLNDLSALAEVSTPECIQGVVSGKYWQALHSQRSQDPRGEENPLGPSPSQGQTSSRDGHEGSRHSLRKEGSQSVDTKLCTSLSGWAEGQTPCDPWSLVNSLESAKLGMVASVCTSCTQKVEARGKEVQGHPWLHTKFEASLDYKRPCLQNK